MTVVVVVIFLLAWGGFGLVTACLRFAACWGSPFRWTGTGDSTALLRYADLFRSWVWRGGPALVGATPGLRQLRGFNASLGTGLLGALVLRRRTTILIAITPLSTTGGYRSPRV
jgi:hypothetical protein